MWNREMSKRGISVEYRRIEELSKGRNAAPWLVFIRPCVRICLAPESSCRRSFFFRWLSKNGLLNIDLVQCGDETRAGEHMWLDDQEPWVVRTEKTAIPSQCVQYCVESKRRRLIICSCGWFCTIGKLAALFWVVPLMVVSPRSEWLVSLVYPGWLAFLVCLCHVLSQTFQEEDEIILSEKIERSICGVCL